MAHQLDKYLGMTVRFNKPELGNPDCRWEVRGIQKNYKGDYRLRGHRLWLANDEWGELLSPELFEII